MRKLLAFVLFLFPLAAYASESYIFNGEITRAQLVSETDAITTKPFWVGLDLQHKTGWHSYTNPPGEAGLATSIEWELPPGFTAEDIYWPPATTIKEGTITTYGYMDKVLLPVRIRPAPDVKAGDTYTLTARATWLVCHEICIPERGEFTLTLSTATETRPSAYAEKIRALLDTISEAKPAAHSANPQAPPFSILTALVFALLGGLVLNLMPCVFPVLSLKCLAVAKQGGISRRKAIGEGMAYTAGVLACFTAMAGVLIALQRGGEVVGWGFQMQSPGFVAFMALLLFLIGLNLSGFFSLPVLLGNVGAELTHEPTLRGSFLTGMLATLVATPCTAPFMASAVGYALAQPPVVALLVFEALGLGLALPFLLVSLFPRLLKRLPKPGAWMETMKELLAFPMYLSAIWLAWVLAQQASPHAVGLLLLVAALLVFVFWCRRFFASDSRGFHIGASTIVIGLTAGAVYAISHLPMPSSGSALLHGGEPYSESRLSELRAQGKPVFVDATAAWCITCQVNFHSTLSTAAVQDAFREKGVVFMVADWTRRDDAITKFLESFGYRGVPLYVYYPPKGAEPKVLPQILTPAIVTDAL